MVCNVRQALDKLNDAKHQYVASNIARLVGDRPLKYRRSLLCLPCSDGRAVESVRAIRHAYEEEERLANEEIERRYFSGRQDHEAR